MVLAAAAGLVLVAGCHRSQFIAASIENTTGDKLGVVEVDYPNASFGVSTLAPHGSYQYRFKPLASGPLTLSYTDAAGAPHTSTGPQVSAGQPGSVKIEIGAKGAVAWRVEP